MQTSKIDSFHIIECNYLTITEQRKLAFQRIVNNANKLQMDSSSLQLIIDYLFDQRPQGNISPHLMYTILYLIGR